MIMRKRAVLVAYSTVAAAVSLILVAFLAVQIQQRTIRWRAERLSADMHTIRLYRSTWADAQRLMQRWGAWGHYDGNCTAADCKYEIHMAGISDLPYVPSHAWLYWLLRHDRLNLYSWFGGRNSAYLASFTVHDGTVWRESTSISVSVPRKRIHSANWGHDNDWEDLDQSFSLGAASYQKLRRTDSHGEAFLRVGPEDTLAGHPYYKVGGPDGCMLNCEVKTIYYSTHTPPAEIQRLTSYDFSCFTRFNPCTEIEDLLPGDREWHSHKEELQQASLPEKLCDVPVWALARDARYVLAIEVLSTEPAKDQHYLREVAKVRVVSSLKEPAPWLSGAVVTADIYKWLRDSSPSSEDQHLVPGRRYIVFPIGNDRRDRLVTKDSPLTFERCGVQEDTPEARRELEDGFAQNDALRP
jgi:hypothetical protein